MDAYVIKAQAEQQQKGLRATALLRLSHDPSGALRSPDSRWPWLLTRCSCDRNCHKQQTTRGPFASSCSLQTKPHPNRIMRTLLVYFVQRKTVPMPVCSATPLQERKIFDGMLCLQTKRPFTSPTTYVDFGALCLLAQQRQHRAQTRRTHTLHAPPAVSDASLRRRMTAQSG